MFLDKKTDQNTNDIGLCKKNDVTNDSSPLDMMNILEMNVSEKLGISEEEILDFIKYLEFLSIISFE